MTSRWSSVSHADDVTALEQATALFATIDAAGSAAPSGGSFDPSVFTAIRDAGLYGISVPREVGGVDLPLVEALDVWAEVARADASIGWCLFASDVALAYFGAYLGDDGADAVFGGGLPLMGGQFAPNGTAEQDGDGWIVTGSYQFGSGITIADFGGAGFMATPADGGDAAYLFGCYPASEIEPRGNWDVIGLQSTQSIDYGLNGVRVPDNQTFDFFASVVHRGTAKHHLGVLPLTAVGHAAWALGVTRRMLDELRAIAAGRVRMGAATSLADSEHFLISYARLESRYEAGRAWVREVCEQAEAECAGSGAALSVLTANRVRQACSHVKQSGADIAREAYLLSGTAALREGPLQRCFRDLHAGALHFFGSNAASVDYARSLLELT